MKFENTEVFNITNAMRGMRNPMNSWDKNDSGWIYPDPENEPDNKIEVIGENDLELAQKLIKAGPEHRKFLRQIFVSVDITAPMYFFSEFDTYKIGTTANSTSKMHKLASTPITKDCFEKGDETGYTKNNQVISEIWDKLIFDLEDLRISFNDTKDKRYWKELIRLLPESWLQKRTITMNYENVLNMYQQRCVHPHKLTEWSVDFANWVKSLPYAKEFFGAE